MRIENESGYFIMEERCNVPHFAATWRIPKTIYVEKKNKDRLLCT